MRGVVFRLWGQTWLQHLGMSVFALGSGLDLTYHLAPGSWSLALAQYLGQDGARAHELTLVGMLLVLTSVLQVARARARERAR